MTRYDLLIKKTSVHDNVKIIADTIALALNETNKMLPYMDRVTKILPELKDEIHGRMTCDSIFTQVEKLLIRRLEEADGAIKDQMIHFEDLAREKLTAPVLRMLELFEIQHMGNRVFRCYLGFYNPFPRNVLTGEYWLYYGIPDDIFLRASLHEINHMILFEKWKELYGYKEEKEPEYPDILWFLEELAIEPVLNDSSIQELLPIRHRAYDSLRAIEIEGKPITTQIQEIYDARSSMGNFLEEAYFFLQSHSKELC